jgi:hypothetical protein
MLILTVFLVERNCEASANRSCVSQGTDRHGFMHTLVSAIGDRTRVEYDPFIIHQEIL